ncbi:MAG: sulfite exporter TauE/SafE family protein, partial [Bradyrhizobium sp.]
MFLSDLVSSVSVGLVGGVTSGLLGVSPGGGLVVFSNLLLGSEQHVAQGISLVAQIPPTSVSGIRRYRE